MDQTNQNFQDNNGQSSWQGNGGSIQSSYNPPMPPTQNFGGGYTQGDDGTATGQQIQGDDSTQGGQQIQADDTKKIDLPEISDEEAANFDMRSFDENLKPDLVTLADDSLGKALGTQGKQYDGGHMTVNQQFEDICNTQIAQNSLNFDSKEFLELLAGSISLMYAEKKAIIDQIPKLSQFQIDELIKILREEKKKFAALNKKHSEELKKIEAKHDNSEEKEKLHNEELSQRSADEDAAAELLRRLQGGN